MKAKGSTLRSRCSDSYFDEMPPEVRRRAEEWFAKFRDRWEWNLPNWRLAILVGQARRLALNPPSSAWGRSMLAARGGRALQRAKREQRATLGCEPDTSMSAAISGRRGTAAKLQAEPREVASVEFTPCSPSLDRMIQQSTPPSHAAHSMHILLDAPDCRCYYCAWPNHDG
jgi:hypothetical protein